MKRGIKRDFSQKRYRIHAQKGDAWLIPGDIHFGFEDTEAVATMELFFEDFQAKRKGYLNIGDAIDSHPISRHDRDADRLADIPLLMDEVDMARPHFQRMAEHELGAFYLEGNHEYWLQKIISKEPGLARAPGLTWGNLTGLSDIAGLEIIPYGTWIDLGDNIGCHHGKGLPSSIKQVTLKYPDQFTVYGHTHNAELRYRTVWTRKGPRVRGALNVGCMERLNPEFCVDPDWQTAFSIIEFFGDQGDGTPFFKPHLFIVVRDKDGRPHVA